MIRHTVSQEYFWDTLDEFTKRYVSIKAPAFVCTTKSNENFICVLPLISYDRNQKTHSFIIDYEDISYKNKRVRWNTTTNITLANGGSDVEVSVVVSSNAHKSFKVQYPARMRFKEMYYLLLGYTEECFLNTYDVLDDIRTKYIWQPFIEYTDIYTFYTFRFHVDEEIVDISELVLQ